MPFYGPLLLAFVLAACMPAKDVPELVDPTTVERTGRPNDALVCQPIACDAHADYPSPIFEASTTTQYAAWLKLIAAAPRTRIERLDEERELILATQRSRVFRFVDEITIKVMPVAGGRSTFAIYSRARSGYWDVGVNKERVARWISQLRERLAPS